MTVHVMPRANRALLLGCAIAALCVAASQVDAQAFNATPKTVAGAVTYDRATPGVETVTLETPTAIINWIPGVGVFLPAGNTATFTNGINVTDFVVLNRIQSSTPVHFDGHVISQIQDLSVGTSAIGGTVLFSSPGGIVIGPTAVFDVGNLVLTSLNVVDDGTGNFYDPATQGYFFQPGGVPDAAVVTIPGSRINALNEGSYVALLSPQIVHAGSIRVNGSAAFVAGEQIQMRVNQGLFDIIVDTGSDRVTPLVHSGSTGGPASTGAGDNHRIYMVAVPKNQAITAILQGNIGFDPAINAAVENGAIVLSAGFSVIGGQVDRYGDFGPPPKPGPGASIEIRGGTITSDLFGYASTDMLASGGAVGGSLQVLQDVSLFAGRRAHLFAGAGQTVTVAGNALVSAARLDTADPALFDLTGGEALIFATQDGQLVIAGNATADASGRGIVDQVNSRAGHGTGGTAGIFADTGRVRIGGSATVLATGQGGTLDFAPLEGGTGTGGAALVEGRNGGMVQIGGALGVDASGTGSRASGFAPAPAVGAPGIGGNISVSAIGGGSVTVAAGVTITSFGKGGEVLNGPGNAGGTGTGGNISILAGGTLTFAGAATISANGLGGLGPNGGAAIGGRIVVDANAGQIGFLGDTVMDANATGADAAFEFGGTGGGATGGDVLIRARSGAAAAGVRGGAITISARGTGGIGANGVLGLPAGRGGDGRGGNVDILAEAGNGTVQFGATGAQADGTGGRGGNSDLDGDGGRGGNGFGGAVRAGSTAGAAGTPATGSARFASLDLRAAAVGGQGGGGSGVGGNATGGVASLLAAGIPTLVSGPVNLNADATGGSGGFGPVAGGPTGPLGLADGGTVIIAATAFGASPGTLTAQNVTGSAAATGLAGTGNSPGEWHVRASGGSTISLANLTLTAQTSGAPAVRPFSSLEPQGGVINVTQVAALSTPGEIRVLADAGGRITGGRLGLTAGDDIIVTHSNVQPSSVTIDVSDFFATAGDDFSAGAGVLTRSSNQTDIRAADLATVAGRILGREVLIASSDIDLAATGAIGDAGTQLATLLLNTTGQTAVLGGTTQGPGYTLTNAEAGRIRAGTLRILAPALGTGTSLIVRDLTFNGGGAASGIGMLEINTPGIARVEGALSMTNALAGNGISFTARERIEVPTATGSIRVRDALGMPGGNLLLASNNIWIASQAIIDQLRLNPNYAARDADLLANGGVEEQRGYVESGTVVLATGGTLFVQNSGPPFSPAFAGVTVGAGGLTVRPTGTTPAIVTAFGRRLNADGSLTLATPFFLAVNFPVGPVGANGPGYTFGSTFNTCIIVTGQCGAGAPVIAPQGPDPITGPTGGSAAIVLAGAADEDDLVDTSFSNDPLIEEPVTSGGESSLWECDTDHDGDCDDRDR